MFDSPAGEGSHRVTRPAWVALHCRMEGSVTERGDTLSHPCRRISECRLHLSTGPGRATTGNRDIGITYRFGRPTYRAGTRRLPLGARPTYRGPRDQLTVDKFGAPATYPQDP